MFGIELADDCPDLVGLALKQNLLINVTAGKVIRLLPPLIISDEQAEEIVERLCIVLKDYLKEAA
jgi:acetylornithine/N-succinyldiaminopimelate aminotransferase